MFLYAEPLFSQCDKDVRGLPHAGAPRSRCVVRHALCDHEVTVVPEEAADGADCSLHCCPAPEGADEDHRIIGPRGSLRLGHS